jgi:hypothetical protein
LAKERKFLDALCLDLSQPLVQPLSLPLAYHLTKRLHLGVGARERFVCRTEPGQLLLLGGAALAGVPRQPSRGL